MNAQTIRDRILAEVIKRRAEHLATYTSEHDQGHGGGELGEVGAIFANAASAMTRGASAAELRSTYDGFSDLTYPFTDADGGQEPPLKETARENYIEALAVLLAEVERIDLLPHMQAWRK